MAAPDFRKKLKVRQNLKKSHELFDTFQVQTKVVGNSERKKCVGVRKVGGVTRGIQSPTSF